MRSVELDSLFDKLKEIKSDAALAEESADKAESESHVQRDGKTRSTLTLSFIRGFFGLLIFSCFFVFIYNWAAVYWIIDLKQAGLLNESTNLNFLDLDKVLSIIIGALGTSLGFIIGYYFKEKHT